MRFTVLGGGAWGTALAQVLAESGNQGCLWTWLPVHAEAMNSDRENREFLPGVPLAPVLQIESSLQRALEGSELVVVVVPSHAVRNTMLAARPFLPVNARIVCASKGIEESSLQLMTEVIGASLTDSADAAANFSKRIGVLSGPSFAKEVARGVPTNLVAASDDAELARLLQQVFSTPRLRVYTSADTVGVEVGGALKNVIAIAAGACDGFSLGDNTRAALITRGIAEMSRLVVALGGQAATVSGLAGIGDLVLTCTGDLSRNRVLGQKLARGISLHAALQTSDGVAEGYYTAKSAHELALRLGVELPICEAVYSVLHEGMHPSVALDGLLSRPLRPE